MDDTSQNRQVAGGPTKDRRAAGMVFDVKRFAIHDGPGIRTTVFLKGCPLRCLWCHNPESQKRTAELLFDPDRCIGCGNCFRICPSHAHVMAAGQHVLDRERCTACGACAETCYTDALELIGTRRTVDDVLDEVLRDRPFYENSGGGMTISGGEPLVQFRFARALAAAARAEGLSVCLDTCGYVPYPRLQTMIPLVDVFLYDVKATSEWKHKRLTGLANRRILANLRRLGAEGARIWLRLPLIPGVNDDEEHLEACGRLARTVTGIEAVEIMPYHRLGDSKRLHLGMPSSELSGIESPDEAVVERWVRTLKRAGACEVRRA